MKFKDEEEKFNELVPYVQGEADLQQLRIDGEHVLEKEINFAHKLKDDLKSQPPGSYIFWINQGSAAADRDEFEIQKQPLKQQLVVEEV